MYCKNIFNKQKILFFVLILNLVLSLPVYLKADIPAIKGLHEMFSPDVIGIGQALKSKGWIENVYDNADEKNLARRVIEKFYHKNNPTDSLMLSGLGTIKYMKPSNLGKLLKYIRDSNFNDDGLRSKLKTGIFNQNWDKGPSKAIDIIKKLEELKNSKDFMPFTAEAILWAVFEDKFTKGSKEDALKNLHELLEQIFDNGFVSKKLKEEYKLEEINKKIEEIMVLSPDEQLEKIKAEKDIFAVINIGEYRKNIVSPEISFKPNLKYQYDGKETLDFATCFESAILDLISYLLYDPRDDKSEYNLSILPENANGLFLKEVLKKVFIDEKEKKLVKPKDISSRRQAWINLISNRSNLLYGNEEKDKRSEGASGKIKYNLKSGINNLIKILNDLFSLGIDIQLNSEKLIINIKKINDELILIGDNFEVKKPVDNNDLKGFLDQILKKLSDKLTTDLRTATFYSEDIKSNTGFIFTDNTLEILGGTGKIKVKVEYKNEKDIKFNSQLVLDVIDGHVESLCENRLIGGLGRLYKDEFKDKLVSFAIEKDGQIKNDLLSIYMLLLNCDMVKKHYDLVKVNKIMSPVENLIFYCLPQKNVEQKIGILKLSYINDFFLDSSFNIAKQKFIDGFNDLIAKSLLEEIIALDKNIDTFKDSLILVIEKLADKIDDNLDAQLVIEKILESNKDISLFAKAMEKLIDKINDEHGFLANIRRIIFSDKNISGLEGLFEKLVNKENIDLNDIIFTINTKYTKGEFKKDTTVFLPLIKKIVEKNGFNYNAINIIELILGSKKDSVFLEPLIEKLADKIDDNLDAQLVIEKIIESNKDISGFSGVLEKLADKIDNNFYAKEVIEKIIESNKDASGFSGVLEKLANKIDNYIDAKKVIGKILKSNKDISGFLKTIENLVDKISDDSVLAGVVEEILKLNKDISGLSMVMEKLAAKISSDSSAEAIIKAIIKYKYKINNKDKIIEKLSEKIQYEYYAQEIKKVF